MNQHLGYVCKHYSIYVVPLYTVDGSHNWLCCVYGVKSYIFVYKLKEMTIYLGFSQSNIRLISIKIWVHSR